MVLLLYYGFLFRYPKWGGINDLGFRNNFNLMKLIRYSELL